MLETHISWVILAGGEALKIKKPVDLGFADFSTLERRRHFCEEEIRLNGRLAPQLYREAVAITGTDEAPVIGGDGPAIEYAVRMQRFPQEDLLPHVLRRGELSAGLLEDTARQIARLHQQIAVARDDSQFGTPDQIIAPVRENFRHLEHDDLSPQTRETVAALKQWSEEEFARLHDRFAARRADGFIRECHGDMHLGNMVLLDGQVTIFDGIDFNENLRWIDVLSELAFLVMDLEDRGRPDLAHRVLNVYLEETGDYTGLAVWSFYLTYRALVRAKVAAIRLSQNGIEPDERDDQLAEFHGYLELATRYTAPPAPMLIITHGVTGSGKSTGSLPLIEELGAIRVRSDVERKRLNGLRPRDHSGSATGEGIYTSAMHAKTYGRLHELADALLTAGQVTIVDATFLKRAHRDRFRKLAAEHRVPFAILAFEADEPVLRNRIRSRQQAGTDASEAGLAVLERHLRGLEPPTGTELTETIHVHSEAGESDRAAVEEIRRRRDDV